MRPTEPSARSRRVPLATLGLLLLAFLVVVIGSSALSSHAHSGSAPPPLPRSAQAPLGKTSGTPAYTGPLGIPAIHPRAALAASTGPHFTLADVKQYLATNPLPDVVSGAPAPTVASFTCESPQEAPAQDNIGSYPDHLVCIVIVSGSFIGSYSGPLLARPIPTPAPFTKGLLIFDAYTGNLLATNLD
jgi:hypothetical protein